MSQDGKVLIVKVQKVVGHRINTVLRLAGAAAVITALAGCSSSMDDARGFQLVDPATYLYYTCPQLVTARTAQTKRYQELQELMAKAERDPGGQIASAVAYRGEYQATIGRLQLIDASWRERNCETEMAKSSR